MLQKPQSKSNAKFKYLLLVSLITGILTYTSSATSNTLYLDTVTINDINQKIEESEKGNIIHTKIWQEINVQNNQNSLNKQEQVNETIPSTPTISSISKGRAEPKCANKVGHYNYNIDNYLKLEIGNSADVIIDLISLKTSESVRTVYIPKNTEYYIRNIPEDKYFVRIIYGEGYQETNNNGVCELSFENVKKRESGEDELDFNTVKTDIGINVPNYSLAIDIR